MAIAWPTLPPDLFVIPSASQARNALAIACAAASLISGCGAGADTGRSSLGPLLQQLAEGAPAARSLEGRTSAATAYAPCVQAASLPLRARCPTATAPDAATLRVAARAAALVRDSLSADALHASALVDLLWGDPAGKSLARSLQSLTQAARHDHSATTWADLAAAELARADRDDDPRARLSALDAAARAVSADSANVVARFNLALAAERVGLDGRAREEWMRYLDVERDEGWRSEARARIAAIGRRAVPDAFGPLDHTRLEALAERDPAALRTRVLTRELGEWSGAALAGDSARAGAALATMRAAGRQLASRHGDSTVLAVAGELAAPSASRGIARAAADFAAAQRAAQAGRYAQAESLFARSASAAPSATMAAWARTLGAVQGVFTGRADASRRLRAEMHAARAAGRPALEARAGWSLAVVLLRGGRYAEANEVNARVVALSSALGDRETVAAVSTLRGEDRYLAGDERTAWRLIIDAMSTLRGHRASLRLRNALALLAHAADERGLSGAAALIRTEDAAVALASGHPEFHAEALLAAARSHLLQGDTSRAIAMTRQGQRAAEALPASDLSRWLASQAALLRASAGVPNSGAALDSAVEYFGARRNDALLVDALLTRARASASRDEASAERDLDSALTLASDRASAHWRTPSERRALERRIHDIAARLALSYLGRHQDARALGTVERGRGGPAGLAGAIAPGTLVIDYLLAGDTLVAWSITPGAMTTTRTVVSARGLALARERLRRGAGLGAMDRDASATLYDALLRPHRAAMARTERLVIVADDELAGVPFAALYDSSGAGAYLVERASVRVVASLAGAAPTDAPRGAERPLFVSDPAFDRAAFPGLAALPGARGEVEASRRFYPESELLAGSSATPSAVTAAMKRAGMVHFASHAWFDAERPEQSALALASDGADRGALTARAISAMRLGNVRLAVLSSCESTRSGVADAPFTVGLARAFHDAGVPGVIGALWPVDDDATARLMTEFHRHYSASRDAASALRQAQLALLRDPRASRRDAAAWGAFVFTGH